MPKFDKDQGMKVLKNTIKTDARHRDYPHVVNLATKYKQYATGRDIDSLLKRFTPSESDELFKQRKEITSLVTPDIINTLATPMYKVGRTTANESMVWSKEGDQEKNRKILTDLASKFYGDQSVNDYLTYMMVNLDCTDPNSFIVVEFDGTVDPADTTTKAKPYPFLVNSTEAVHFKYINNELQWLIVLNESQTKYTMYLENEAIVAHAVKKEDLEATKALPEFKNAEIFYKNDDNKNDGIFLILVFEHKAGRIPARRVGTMKDTSTDRRTCVPMIHPADAYLQKSIKTISELDLTMALHAFPKVFRYGDPCKGDLAHGIVCNEGILQGSENNEKCPKCKGSGWSNQTTTATDVIVKAPKDLKDMVNLENMMAYKAPNADLLKFQKEYGLVDLRQYAIKAVYNSDTYVSDSIVKTATEAGMDFEAIYDTLKPFADSWAQMKMHIMYTIAAYRDLSDQFEYLYAFGKDFKMKSIAVLLADLKAATDSGAPSYIIKSINHDIAKKMYVDQPDELLRIQTKEKFFPFNGKTANEINYIMANSLKSRFDMVLYGSFDQIFDELEAEQSVKDVDFYKMAFPAQKELIKSKVDALISELDSQAASERATSFANNLDTGLGG